MSGEREIQDLKYLQRGGFNTIAEHYDAARPGYPEALFDDIVALSGIPSGGQVLEIGCGSGVATAPMARRGYQLHCVDLGDRLAAEARRNLAEFPNVHIDVGAFETFPLGEEAYDLVMSATAFHWLDQPVGYEKSARVLKPRGSIAIFRHDHVKAEADDGFFEAVQEEYRMAGMSGDHVVPAATEVIGVADEIDATGLFGPVAVRRYTWDQEYDAEGYIRLLSTYSGHIEADPATQHQLFDGMAAMIDTQFGGKITKGYLVILHVAQRI